MSVQLLTVAEAIAEGRRPDWLAADAAVHDAADRAVLEQLRAVADIGHVIARITSVSSLTSVDFLEPRTSIASGAAQGHPAGEWGGLTIRDCLGQGRFGSVYRAWDPSLDREVALKLLHRSADRTDSEAAHVIHEGRMMARVRHPNVATIYGAQQIEGRTGLWMELIDGRTLEAELGERGPFEAPELTQVGIELCRALAAVHRAGLVHRDVKAQNVMREAGGRIVLTDFGTGRELEQSGAGRKELAGTPAYLAPEVFRGEAPTAGADLYSLGVLLFHLATGRFPVEGGSAGAIRHAHARGERTTLTAARPDLPAPLSAAIDRALDPDPSGRFADAEQMSAALAAWLETPAAAPRTTPGRRHSIVAAATAVALLLASMATGFVSWRPEAVPATVPFAARDWVLVTSFENRTGEPQLDGAVEYALERELSNSPHVNVVPQARLADTLQLMLKPAVPRVDVSTAREVALRDGEIRALVSGRIEKLGGAYALTADLVNPSDGAILTSVRNASIGQADLLTAIGRVALDVRQRLGEVLPQTMQPGTGPPKVTTTSWRALQLYSQALALQDSEGTFGPPREGRAAAAERLLREALAEDPQFASAYVLLSITIRLQDPLRMQEALEQLDRATAVSLSATRIEKLTAEAESYAVRRWIQANDLRSLSAADAEEVQRQTERAIAAFEAVLELDGNNHQALISLTDLYSSLGKPNARIARRLADLRPTSARWQVRAAWAVLAENQHDRETALGYMRRAQRLSPANPAVAYDIALSRLFEAEEAWRHHDLATALRIIDAVAAEAQTLPRTSAQLFSEAVWKAYTAMGRFDQAETSAAVTPGRRNALAIIGVFREDRQALAAYLKREFSRPEEAARITSALVEAGLLVEARRALRQVNTSGTDGPPGRNEYLQMAEGQLALAEGRVDDAIIVLEPLANRDALESRPVRWLRIARTLAEAWRRSGDLERAIALLELAPSQRELDRFDVEAFYLAPEWLQLRDRLAALYREAGRISEAEAVEADLLPLLDAADEDHPIKRRLLARRQATPPVTTSSSRALELYEQAVAALEPGPRGSSREAAKRLFAEALVYDPEFALAHMWLAELEAKGPTSDAHLQRALAGAAHATERERLELTARATQLRAVRTPQPAQQQKLFHEAAGALEAWLKLEPANQRAATRLVTVYRRTGRDREATELQVRVADANVRDPAVQIDAARALLFVNDWDRGQRFMQRARSLGVEPDALSPEKAAWFQLYDAQRAWLRGDVEAALQLTDAVAARAATATADQRNSLGLYLVSMYVTLGRFAQAEQARMWIPDLIEQDFHLVNILAQRGDINGLRNLLHKRFAETSLASRVGSIWIDLGELEMARQVVVRTPLLYYQGQLALATGNPHDAIRLLELALNRDGLIGNPNRSRTARKLADALVAVGQLTRAIAVLEADSKERVAKTAGPPAGYEWLNVRRKLAELYRRAERHAEAQMVETELLELLAVADSDHPIWRELIERHARDAGAPR